MTSETGDDLISVTEAAQLLGVTTRHVRRLKQEGKLAGVQRQRIITVPQTQPGLFFRRADVLALTNDQVETLEPNV